MDIYLEIVRLLPPPRKKQGADGNWALAEKNLGAAFPDDYKWFIGTYGIGTIEKSLWIYSPFGTSFHRNLWETAESVAQNYRGFYKDQVITNPGPPFRLFPELGGLFTFGGTTNGNDLNWNTKGAPNKWNVVAWDPDFLMFRDLKGFSLSKLLLEAIQGRDPGQELFPSDWLAKPKKFIPGDPAVAQ
jgi:hypothetical protein